MQYCFARSHVSEDNRDNGRHAGREYQPAFSFLVDCKPILDDFEVWMIESRIDEASLPVDRRRAASSHIVEIIAPLLRCSEYEGGAGAELLCPFPGRVLAIRIACLEAMVIPLLP